MTTPSEIDAASAKVLSGILQTFIGVCVILGIYMGATDVWWLLGIVMVIAAFIILVMEGNVVALREKIPFEKKQQAIKDARLNDQRLHNSAYGNWVKNSTCSSMGNSIDNTMHNGFQCDIAGDVVIGYDPTKGRNDAVMLIKSTTHGFVYILENTEGSSAIIREGHNGRRFFIGRSAVRMYSSTTSRIIKDIAEFNIKFVSDREIKLDDIIGIDDVNMSHKIINAAIMANATI